MEANRGIKADTSQVTSGNFKANRAIKLKSSHVEILRLTGLSRQTQSYLRQAGWLVLEANRADKANTQVITCGKFKANRAI